MSATNLDHKIESIDFTRGNGGLADSFPIPGFANWTLGTFATAMGRSNSAAAYILPVGGSNQVEALRWKATATTTDIAQFQMMLDPRKRLHSEVAKSGLHLILRARKLDTTGSAAEDSALGFSVTATFASPKYSDDGTELDGTGFVTSTADAQLLPAKSADNAPAAFRTYRFNLLKGLTDAQKAAIGPMSTVAISIAPSKTVGTALAAEILNGGHLFYHRHLTPWRWLMKTLRA